MGLYFYFKKKDEYVNSVRITGMVVDQLYDGRPSKYSDNVGFYPQFQFYYNDSLYISADKLIWTNGKEPGSKIKLIFPNSRPEDAKAYTFVSYWISFPHFMVSFLTASFIFMLPYLYYKTSSRSRFLRNK